MKLLPFKTLVVLLAFVAVACASDSWQATPATSAQETVPMENPIRPDRVPLVEGPWSHDGLKVILGTADLGVGLNRFGFVLTSPSGFVTAPETTVVSRYYASDSGMGETRETVIAVFQPWPYGNKGLYTVELTFDSAGDWVIDVDVDGPGDSTLKAQLRFEVTDSPLAPAVGQPAIKSVSKTVADVEHLAELTTGSRQDPDLYQVTVAAAVSSGKPTVVVFASPAFCTNAVCGPQVEVLQQLKGKYRDQVNFIHVDFYDNPHEIQGDLDRARLSPVVLEWALPSIEWTYVVDSSGLVSARFEAFATFDEVEEALLQVLWGLTAPRTLRFPNPTGTPNP